MSFRDILGKSLYFLRRVIPASAFKFFQPAYHFCLAFISAFVYGFPSKKLVVIGVTGTNGKTTVVEIVRHILNKNGIKTASVSSVYFCVGDACEKNTFKMTMPGRFHLQKFLKKCLKSGITHVVLEVTSQGVLQSRHRAINFDYVVFTNITPEHIEAHGGFEKYRNAKLEFFRHVSSSAIKKIKGVEIKKRAIVNGDDSSARLFLDFPFDIKKTFQIKNFNYYNPLLGDFNKANILAAAKVVEEEGVSFEKINEALRSFAGVPGRMEFIFSDPFTVIVDYAHTPEALEKVYGTLRKKFKTGKLICVLGSAGGGRDKWKREEFGELAANFCDKIILTNEDPYDEDPGGILDDIEKGFYSAKKGHNKVDFEKIIDRKEAIKKSVSLAGIGDAVVITGKGAEMWIMGPKGQKTSWDDREAVKMILERL